MFWTGGQPSALARRMAKRGRGTKTVVRQQTWEKRNSKKSFVTCEELPTLTFSADTEITFGVVDWFVVGRF